MKRRTLLRAGAAATLYGWLTSGHTQAQATSADDYTEIRGPFPTNYRLYGTNPATGPEEDKAREILAGCKKNMSLLETAQYFEALKDVNSDGYQYNAQWPDVTNSRWNPVLIGFYQSTSLPHAYVYKNGDTIDWCAAFINWCLATSGYKTTNSAMSGSFRTYGVARKPGDAKAGDIIVFRKAGTSGDNGHGHVAIYLGKEGDKYQVLGGNQKAGKSFSSVNTTVFDGNNPNLRLHSIRAIESMKV